MSKEYAALPVLHVDERVLIAGLSDEHRVAHRIWRFLRHMLIAAILMGAGAGGVLERHPAPRSYLGGRLVDRLQRSPWPAESQF
jgi:hypothetical protein